MSTQEIGAEQIVVLKRDSRKENFKEEKIYQAVNKCLTGLKDRSVSSIQDAVTKIIKRVTNIIKKQNQHQIDVEDIQRLVIQQLWAAGEFEAAENYTIFREIRRYQRMLDPVSNQEMNVVKEDAKHFPTPMQYYQFISKFSRWNENLKRRETWSEACDRVMTFFSKNELIKLEQKEWDEIRDYMFSLKASPALRVLQMAGPATENCHVAVYNCSYAPISDVDVFSEMLYILMQGTGFGFSVESDYVDMLPRVRKTKKDYVPSTYVIEDSTIGWCEAFREGLNRWFAGEDIIFDYSNIRPAGARLKTKGGRACLTGDTVIHADKKLTGKKNNFTIRDAYDLKKTDPDTFYKLKLRCLDESAGVFYKNSIVDVIDNGLADVFTIKTKKGYTIKATNNHRFMSKDRKYKELEKFKVGEMIGVNGVTLSVKKLKNRKLNNKKHKPDFCEVCNRSGIKCELYKNNKVFYICEICDKSLEIIHEAKKESKTQRYLSFDEISSITYYGKDIVYDICMKEPDHNFVANGFVSHNSGPEPLKQLMNFVRDKIKNKNNGRLSSIDCHDICCMIGKIVQVGGVRRASEISLSDLDDMEMREAKSGQWWETASWRDMANNSAVYEKRPDSVEFMDEWLSLAKSGSGERGIFNREAIYKTLPDRRKKAKFGTNPCAEIVLRPYGFCNLSIAIARYEDTEETLTNKVRIATIFGVMQSTMTKFKFIRKEWKDNAEEERLLGVDITGQMDCPLLRPSNLDRHALLKRLAKVVAETAEQYSKRFGINLPAANTCIKPSGDSSQFFDCSSGVHPRHAMYYIRRVRGSVNDPVSKLMVDAGVPYQIDPYNTSLFVFEFPMKSPEGCITRNDMTAIQMLENWLDWKTYWAEHSVSCTVYVEPHEWFEAGNWIYKNFDQVSGLSFLPKSNGNYQLLPYEEINEEEYNKRKSVFPEIDWSKLRRYEKEDMTTSSQEYACVGGLCERV